MQQIISLRLLPSEVNNYDSVRLAIAQQTNQNNDAVTGFVILKKSLDARGKQPYFNLAVNAFINEPFHHREIKKIELKDVSKANHRVIIIGAGPAGLFAAIQLISLGIKPIILERGKDVRARRRDLAVLNKKGIINPESNYCFGEGGAGTYSDGKLYTRSSKRGNIEEVLNILVQFGSEENILYEAHPHIGTNKLPQIITAIREQLLQCGGEVLFEKKVTDFIVEKESIKTVLTSDGSIYNADAFVLATGHSARDIFELLHSKNILIEAKPFALGVRIEHPQSLIDSMQYHCSIRGNDLPPASYSFVEQVDDKGIFSFCMCPGGIIAPASTNDNELVVNGWSPSKRNNPFANSGMVVTVDMQSAINHLKAKDEKSKWSNNSPLTLMYFQQAVEQSAFKFGGGKFTAPAQRLVDFCNKKISGSLPSCSYVPGVTEVQLQNVLPGFIYKNLKEGFKIFGQKRKGFFTNEAIVLATESRTSSPVRIPRDADTLHHPQIKNLFPCGEGAGYAGGIVSAAMDGQKVAKILALNISK